MIVLSAIELVDAQEGEKRGNYEPGEKIPPRASCECCNSMTCSTLPCMSG